MAQTTILASATTEGMSTDVLVAAGSNATLGLFVAVGTQFAHAPLAVVFAATPGGNNKIGELDNLNKTLVVTGPGTFRVFRFQRGTACGVYADQ